MNDLTHCRICASSRLEPVIDLGLMALTGVFPKTPTEDVPVRPLRLLSCGRCGLVQLANSCPPDWLYGDGYGYRSGLNQSMVRHLENKVKWLQELRPLREGELVLDIGSNDGTLLNCYPDTVRRIGFDPSAKKFASYYKPGIDVTNDFFSACKFCSSYPGQRAAIVTSIAMFYDLESPSDFVDEIASILTPDGIWHMELAYLPTVLSMNAYDGVCHEHILYFGLKQILMMAKNSGLVVIDVRFNDINGGSFAVTLARTGKQDEKIGLLLADEEADTTPEAFDAFRNRVVVESEKLTDELGRLRDAGKKVLGYGASTKGNVILQHCGITKDLLPTIMEVNELKFGCVTPGTHIPIISEAEGHAMNPDVLLVLPWHFKKNIIARETDFLWRGGTLLFPLPKLHSIHT